MSRETYENSDAERGREKVSHDLLLRVRRDAAEAELESAAALLPGAEDFQRAGRSERAVEEVGDVAAAIRRKASAEAHAAVARDEDREMVSAAREQ